MPPESEVIEMLTTLNQISESLNRAVDVRGVLERALAKLVELMGLETAWISLREPIDKAHSGTSEWVLAAHYNLPPALNSDDANAWQSNCACRNLSDQGCLTDAYNEIRCSRLSHVSRDSRGLAVHATAPLRAGDDILGLLNVAAPEWSSFSPKALSLLTNVGNQMGVALERARLYDLLREQRGHEQNALLDLSQQLLGRLDLDELISYLVREVKEILYADACALLLPSQEPGLLEFRASSGWHRDPGLERRHVPADDSSGPGLVMRTHRPLLVENLRQHDPTPWAPAWLQSEGFQGHAVVPLLTNNHSVGVLVIDQRQPRLLEKGDMRCLQLMANQAAIAIETARLHTEEIRMQAMEKELEVGRQIQLSLLPQAPPAVQGWEFAAAYEAAREVGGDFYDFFQAPPGSHQLGMVIADVIGKGVPAALLMAQASTTIRSTAQLNPGPASTLEQVNQLLFQYRRPANMFTALYAVLDTKTGRLVYANAGHCRPLWVHAKTGQVSELATRGIILGALDSLELKAYDIEIEEGQIHVEPGDLLVFFSDGVTEAMNAKRRMFGNRRLRSTVTANARASAQEMLDAIVDAVQAFTGSIPHSDDFTLFVARRSPQPS